MKQKLLIIGGSGLVGSTLAEYALSDYDIHLTYNKNMPQNTLVKSTAIDLLAVSYTHLTLPTKA